MEVVISSEKDQRWI